MSDSGWHLDRRVPIALIAVILTQTVGAVWWAATQSARVDTNTREIVRVEGTLRDMVQRTDNIPERLGRIETRQEYIVLTIERIDRKLEGGE